MPWRRWRIEINAMQNLRLTTPPPLIYYHLLPLSHTHTHTERERERERERLDCFLFNDRERGQLSKMLHLCLCREFSVHYIWITNSVVSRGVRIPQFCHFLFGVLSTIVGFYQFFFWPIYCFSFDVWLLITFLYLQTFFTFPIYLTQRSNSTSIVTILVVKFTLSCWEQVTFTWDVGYFCCVIDQRLVRYL
jgi:hypothetical protein